jgi:hypothetical protein
MRIRTTPDDSIPRLFFWIALPRFLVLWNPLLTLLWSLVAWIPPSALLSCPRKQFPSASGRQRLFKLYGLFGECVCIHFFCSLVSIFTNESQVSSPAARTMWLKNSSQSLWFHSKNIYKSRSHSQRFMRTREHFRNPSCAKLVIVSLTDNLAGKSAWNVWRFTRKFWNCEAPSFTNSFGHEQDHHSLQMADHFALHRGRLLARPALNILHHCLTVFHSLRFGCKPPRIIHDGFPQHTRF